MADRPPRPSAEKLARYAQLFNDSLSLRHFGARVSFPGGDTVEVLVDPVRPEQRGGMGTEAVNGGVLAAIFDLAIGCTAALLDPTRRSATMQLSVSFLKPLHGGVVRAKSRIDHAGRATLFASAEIVDFEGTICARCQGVVKLSNQSWRSGESPAVN